MSVAEKVSLNEMPQNNVHVRDRSAPRLLAAQKWISVAGYKHNAHPWYSAAHCHLQCWSVVTL